MQKGKAPARQVLKARILLKADASECGEGWSDNPDNGRTSLFLGGRRHDSVAGLLPDESEAPVMA